MISGLDFVYYGPEPWAGMWRNRHQLLTRLAAANRVVYVEPRPYFRAILAELAAGRRSLLSLFEGGLSRLGDSLWTYRTPACAAIGGGPLWRNVARAWRVRHLRAALGNLGIERPVLWLSHPSQADARDDLPARLRLYHVVDEYLGYAGVDERQRAWLSACEAQIIAWADLVIAVTPELVAAKGGLPKARLLPNAADVAAFDAVLGPNLPGPSFARLRTGSSLTELALRSPRPQGAGSLSKGKEGSPPPSPDRGGVGGEVRVRGGIGGEVILGYAGLVSARLDLPLLADLAERRPEWSLVLVGEIVPTGCEAELARLAGLPNVKLIGPQPAAAMPGLIVGWDVGLIPYRVTEETRHASPLKLYEYLAAGLPVVTADVPAVRPFAGLVEIVEDPRKELALSLSKGTSGLAETLLAVERALATDSPAAHAARRAAVREHSWDARVESLSEMLAEALTQSWGRISCRCGK